MDVQRLVVISVGLEDKTEEYKYCWHGFFFANIGNYFITCKSAYFFYSLLLLLFVALI